MNSYLATPLCPYDDLVSRDAIMTWDAIMILGRHYIMTPL